MYVKWEMGRENKKLPKLKTFTSMTLAISNFTLYKKQVKKKRVPYIFIWLLPETESDDE
jgi:hypothetical protein